MFFKLIIFNIVLFIQFLSNVLSTFFLFWRCSIVFLVGINYLYLVKFYFMLNLFGFVWYYLLCSCQRIPVLSWSHIKTDLNFLSYFQMELELFCILCLDMRRDHVMIYADKTSCMGHSCGRTHLAHYTSWIPSLKYEAITSLHLLIKSNESISVSSTSKEFTVIRILTWMLLSSLSLQNCCIYIYI